MELIYIKIFLGMTLVGGPLLCIATMLLIMLKRRIFKHEE